MTAAANEIKQGTSLEVLAPYLPYGIDVETDRGVRRRLSSLFYGNKAHVHKMDGEQIELGWLSVELSYIKPVLRPFTALCTPLEDGTVPAVEVAKLLLNLNPTHCDDAFLAGIHAELDFVGDCEVLDWERHTLCWIYGDWLISAKDTMTDVSIYDYLRRKHFALPVNGRPLVEGVDYIAKQPAAASPLSTKEGSAARPDSRLGG